MILFWFDGCFLKGKIIIMSFQFIFFECRKSVCKFFFLRRKKKMVFDIDGNLKIYMDLKYQFS